MKTVILVLLLATGFAHATQTIPAKIDLKKFDSEILDQALFNCGQELLAQLRNIPICRHGSGSGCQGAATARNDHFEQAIGPDTTQLNFGFGFNDDYSAYHAYDGTAYRFNLEAVASAKTPDRLRLNFTEYFQDDRKGYRNTVKAALITEDAMPIIRVDEKEIKHCHFDQWGNQVCAASTFEYTNPLWVLSDTYLPIVFWKNQITGVVLDKSANFGRYMTCVEARF